MVLQRFDTAQIDKLTIDPDTGFLHATDVPIARVGVFPYRKQDGDIAMEAKLPQYLLSDETVASANEKPVTDDHPEGNLVNAQNAKLLSRGFTSNNAHVDGDYLKVDMTLTDSDLIDKVKKGKQELSIGFSTDVVDQPGEYQGMRYDSVQTGIIINHVAVVKRGRAGHTVRITGDSAEMIEEGEENMEVTKVLLGDTSINVLEADAETVSKTNADLEALKKKIAELEDANKKLKEENDGLKGGKDKADEEADKAKKDAEKDKAKADAMDKRIAELEAENASLKGDALDQAVEARMNLVNKSKAFLGDDYDFKGKDAKTIKVDSIQAIEPDFNAEDKSDEYIEAYFDSMSAHSSKVVGMPRRISETKTPAKRAQELLDERYHLADKK